MRMAIGGVFILIHLHAIEVSECTAPGRGTASFMRPSSAGRIAAVSAPDAMSAQWIRLSRRNIVAWVLMWLSIGFMAAVQSRQCGVGSAYRHCNKNGQ